MGILNLLLQGASKLGWNGGKVPSTKATSRHETYSIDGNPNINLSAAGFIPPKPKPSSLDAADVLNTSKYRNKPGSKYMDKLPK